MAYFQDLSDGLSDGIYLEGKGKISGLVFVLYVYTPAVGYYYYYYSFIRFVSLGLELGLGLGLASIGACLLACLVWKGEWQSGETYREGGLAVAHKAWSFGGGSNMMGIEDLIPGI